MVFFGFYSLELPFVLVVNCDGCDTGIISLFEKYRLKNKRNQNPTLKPLKGSRLTFSQK
jgi:hypothetical protein